MTLENYQNILGLTCVENHVLAYLRAQGFDIRDCYVGSDIKFANLCLQFMSDTENLHTNSIPRLQERLKEDSIISLKRYKDTTFEMLINATSGDSDTILVRIDKDFAVTKFGARGWRDDHFAALQRDDNVFRLINDAPPAECVVCKGELRDIYQNDYFILGFLRHYTQDERLGMYQTYEGNVQSQSNMPDFTADNAAISFRDALQVYKTLQYRAKAYESLFADTPDQTKLQELNKIVMQVEYARLRKQLTPERMAEISEYIIRLEENEE